MSTRSAVPNGPLSVKVYREVAALDELREFWISRQTLPAGNFDFFRSVICSSPAVARPHVIALFRGCQPQLLLPGRLERRKINVRLGYLRIPTPNLNILTFDDSGWLRGASATDSELLARDILDSLRSGEADAANLHDLDTSHSLYESARWLPGRMFSDHLPLLQTRWTRTLTQNCSFVDSLPGKQRYNQRRRTRILFDAFNGDVRIERFHNADQIKQLMRDVEEVSRTSYQRGLGVGFVHDERMYRRLSLAAQQGTLRAHLLYLNQKPCAFWITTLTGGILYSEFLAFDPAYAQYGPGSYLVISVIEEIANEGGATPVSGVDFGPGDAEWKALLANHQDVSASLYIFAPTAKGAALNLARTFASLTDRAAKVILERTGLLMNLKRKWRRLVAQSQGNT